MTDTTSIEQRLRHLFDLVAEKEPIAPAPIDANLWRDQAVGTPPTNKGRRVLAGAVAAAVVVAAAVFAITYGPRSSPELRTGPLGSGPTVAGSYSMTYVVPRTSPAKGSGIEHFFDAGPVQLDIRANGTFVVPGYLLGGARNSGTWSESTGTVTMRFSLPASDQTHPFLVQTIRQLGPNLGSASKPGVVVANGKQIEKWYAVRIHGRSGYETAKAQWVGDALFAGSAAQVGPLQVAVFDLQKGKTSDTGNTSGYSVAIAAIKKFESMPISDVTPAIETQENDEIATIDGFFGLPAAPWSGECDSSGAGKRAATTAWETEPVQSLNGVDVVPLKKAVTDLRHGLTTDKGDTSCYEAAIIDLQGLESATRAEMVKNVPYGYEIGYLNQFFNGRQYVLGGPYNAVVPK